MVNEFQQDAQSDFSVKKKIKKRFSKRRFLKLSKKGTKKRERSVRGLMKVFMPTKTKRKKRILTPYQRLALSRLKKQIPSSNLSQPQMLEEYNRLRQQNLNQRLQKQTQQSPSFRMLRERLIKIQNKSKVDEARRRRILAERRNLGQQMNLMNAHKNLNKIELDFSGVSEDNILKSKNVFKNNPENNILRKRGRTILDLGEENTLRF